MKSISFTKIPLFFIPFLGFYFSCQKPATEHSIPENTYYDVTVNTNNEYLTAVFMDSVPELGSRIAFINSKKDTIIPFGKYSICWTDTIKTYAIVFDKINTKGRTVAIDKNERILFDIVFFDNWPDELHDSLFRVKRNEKIGYANSKGEIVIPCQFSCAFWFENGRAKVTYNCTEKTDKFEHTLPESDEWFYIDTKGKRIK
jgi:hypothetical protein